MRPSVRRWSRKPIFRTREPSLCPRASCSRLAASPPLAARNGLDPFYYVFRQGLFGTLALGVMVLVSMMSPTEIRRKAVLGFLAATVASLGDPAETGNL